MLPIFSQQITTSSTNYSQTLFSMNNSYHFKIHMGLLCFNFNYGIYSTVFILHFHTFYQTQNHKRPVSEFLSSMSNKYQAHMYICFSSSIAACAHRCLLSGYPSNRNSFYLTLCTHSIISVTIKAHFTLLIIGITHKSTEQYY